jgi:hypothetical protein
MASHAGASRAIAPIEPGDVRCQPGRTVGPAAG